ncbi:site-2 protease family protein [Candidatus Uhrbacteria bacterium]|nr:site-2 protease family protein [Candidatus Uhrbacteria bacterium]
MTMILDLLNQNPAYFVAWVAAILIALTIHEYAHALVATAQGDDTAESQGRLTLNPMAHMDMVGFLALIFIGFGWGKPVPFNGEKLKNQRLGPVLVALAGPGANLIMAVLVGILLKVVILFTHLPASNLGMIFLALLLNINIILLIFNLIPIPPLDGSKLLFAVLPARLRSVRYWLERYGSFILLILIILDSALPFSILGWLFNYSLDFVYRWF